MSFGPVSFDPKFASGRWPVVEETAKSKAKIGKRRLRARAIVPRERAARRAAELSARCPFCRDEIQVEAVGWTCCSLCLSRHHMECWREHGCCAGCGGDQNLTFVPLRDDLRGKRRIQNPLRAAERRTRLLSLAAAGLAAGLLGVILAI